MKTKLLTLENLSKYYTSTQTVVMGLNNINLSFETGEFVAVTGESGSGKSTLAKVLAGIHTYENGEMFLNGNPTSHYDQADWEHYRSRFISFISQSYDILPGCTVLKNVISSLILTGIDLELANQKSEEILRLVDLWDMRNRRAAKLSSGQKQRLSIARALAKPAPILIADEPTGNLDKANSEKVIELLAAAAKERLVIMITHDYPEVEKCATRHITIRDGIVESDVVRSSESGDTDVSRQSVLLAKNEENDFQPNKNQKAKKPSLPLYVTTLQLGSRPIWVGVMLFFFVLTAFTIFTFLGTFVVNIDDRFTRVYDNSAFYNGSDDMLAVMRLDGESFTQEDWNAILDVAHVKSVERYGYISDINYYYRENVDYFAEYTATTSSDGNVTGSVSKSWLLGDPSLYMRTVPLFSEETDFLTAGRLPENLYEIIMAADESMLGETIPVFIRFRDWLPNTYILLNMQVVGVTDPSKDTGLYFDERLADTLTGHLQGSSYLYGYDTEFQQKDRFLCSVSLRDAIYENILKSMSKNETATPEEKLHDYELMLKNYTNPEIVLATKYASTHDSTYRYYLEVSEDTYQQLVPTENYGNLITVRMDDYAYTDRVMGAINLMGFASISPYRIGSTTQDPVLAAERLQTLKVCLLSFVAIVALQILVLRAMFGMEIEEFKLLANLGLRCNTAKLSIVLQLLFFTVCGQMIAFIFILLMNQLKVERIVHIVKYLPLPYVLLFIVIHLCTGLLSALWVQRSIGKQIYSFSLEQGDLDMDEEV